MPKILLKRTTVDSIVPGQTDLVQGELYINTATSQLYVKNNDSEIVRIGDALKDLGFQPVNRAGDNMSGNLTLAVGTDAQPPLRFQAPATTNPSKLMPVPPPNGLEWTGTALFITTADGTTRNQIAYINSPIDATSKGWHVKRRITLNGDINGSFELDGTANVTTALTLPTVNPTVGIFGDGKNLPTVQVNAKGLVTRVTMTRINLSTDDVSEGANLYFTNSRARNAISVSGALSYDRINGVINYVAPILETVATSGDYDDLHHRPVVSRSTATSGTVTQVIDTFSMTDFRMAKYLIAIHETAANKIHTTEFMVTHDGEEVFFVEYGTIHNHESLGNLTARIDEDEVEIVYTPSNAFTKTVTFTKTLVPLV